MRSISSSETASAVRSYSFVVFGDACPATRCACSSVPPFDRYAVIPVARNVWQARRRRQPRRHRPPLDHRQHHPPPRRSTAQPPRTVHALEERRPGIVEAARGDVRLERLLGPVVGRHVVALAALLVQPQPAPHALPEVVLAPHPHRRAHPREAVDQDAQESPGPAAPPASPGRSGRGAPASPPATAPGCLREGARSYAKPTPRCGPGAPVQEARTFWPCWRNSPCGPT